MTPSPRTKGTTPPKFMPQIAAKSRPSGLAVCARQKLPNEPNDSPILLINIGDFPWDTQGLSPAPKRWPLHEKLPNEPKESPILLIANIDALAGNPRQTLLAQRGILRLT
jgi:hypothetical protein